MYCSNCGKELPPEATACSRCRHAVHPNMMYPYVCPIVAVPPQRSFSTTVVFAIFLGIWGGHRFYTGHTTTAVIQLFTFGGFGIWSFIDIVLILSNNFYDREGRSLKEYDFFLGLTIILLVVLVYYICWHSFISLLSKFFDVLNYPDLF